MTFDVADDLRHRMLGRNGDHHVHMFRHQVPVENLTVLLHSELAKHLAQVPAQLGTERLSAAFRNENNVLFAVPNTVARVPVGVHRRCSSRVVAHERNPAMDRRNRQTMTASSAEPGGLPLTLEPMGGGAGHLSRRLRSDRYRVGLEGGRPVLIGRHEQRSARQRRRNRLLLRELAPGYDCRPRHHPSAGRTRHRGAENHYLAEARSAELNESPSRNIGGRSCAPLAPLSPPCRISGSPPIGVRTSGAVLPAAVTPRGIRRSCPGPRQGSCRPGRCRARSPAGRPC